MTYDVFFTYIYPELRAAVIVARIKWDAAVTAAGIADQMAISRPELSLLVKSLTSSGWLPDGGRALTQAFKQPANIRSFSVDEANQMGIGDDLQGLSPRSLHIRSRPEPTEVVAFHHSTPSHNTARHRDVLRPDRLS